MGRVVTLLAAGVITVAGISACQTTDVPPYDGAALYMGYCAGCHGPTGAGDGPVAPNLVIDMQDLKTLKARNGGVFPRQMVMDLIDGREVRSSHGTPDMPVWGWEFRMVEDSNAHVAARVEALTNHLEQMQNP
ncbi:MAG: cytochrome c [Pseudomonadales bacterium]